MTAPPPPVDRPGETIDCGVTLEHPCPYNRIGDRQVGYPCSRHRHARCSGFTGGYDDALYRCLCGCHRSEGSK